ncbi:hypothetical protein ACJJTC_019301 [Scirpophaga incertulas]
MESITNKGHHRRTMTALAACNVATLAVAANLAFSINPEDKISLKRGASLTALGLAYFATLFELVNAVGLRTAAGARFRAKYRLTAGDVLDISNKVVSAVQAALSCGTGLVVCRWSCARDFLRTSHSLSEAYAWFGTSYFFYDIWSMYMVHVQMSANPEYRNKVHKKGSAKNGTTLSMGDGVPYTKPTFLEYCRYEPVILLHHLFIGGFGFLVIVWLRGPLGDCTFGFVYLMELSTPLVSLRGILARLRLQRSPLYVANGLAMLLAFLACRLLALPYVGLLYARSLRRPYLQAMASLPLGCKISIGILMLPQFYWFYLMSAGAVKLLVGTKQPLSAGDAQVGQNEQAGRTGRAGHTGHTGHTGQAGRGALHKRS